MIRKVKQIIIWWDTALAITGSVAFGILVNGSVDASFTKDILGVGISVLSIVFSIFFASLTFIISSSDDKFVEFLVENNHYIKILWAFKWTLGALFVALSYSLAFYLHVSYIPKDSSPEHVFWLTEIFLFLFIYSLIASAFSTNDAIKYAKRRAWYVSNVEDDDSR